LKTKKAPFLQLNSGIGKVSPLFVGPDWLANSSFNSMKPNLWVEQIQFICLFFKGRSSCRILLHLWLFCGIQWNRRWRNDHWINSSKSNSNWSKRGKNCVPCSPFQISRKVFIRWGNYLNLFSLFCWADGWQHCKEFWSSMNHWKGQQGQKENNG